MDEKLDSTVVKDQDVVSTGSDDGLTWTEQEEKALVRRVDSIIMPLLVFGFFVLQLDRGNLGNAMTDNFLIEVGINQFQFNVGNQLMFVGIIVFEIPSNLVLYRVGPALWIGCQILAWGLIATFQAFIKGQGHGAYYATRFLLGACECGYIPAGLYTITRFYKKDETSKRFSIFFLGSMIANAAGGIIAYGILHMRDVAGLSGWQWLFLIEGILTLVVAAAFVALFPRSTKRPTSLLGVRYFTENESKILTARVLRDDPSKAHKHVHVKKEEFKATFSNWRLISHVVTTICAFSSTSPLNAYGPSIIATYGYSQLKANAMSSIGYWILIFTTIGWGVAADKWGKRGPLVLLGVSIGCVLMIANRSIVNTNDLHGKFALITLIKAFGMAWHPVHGSWMALNTKSSGERSITMAIFIMSANLAGLASGQIFQAEDKPLYRTAWTTVLSLSCFGVVAAAWSNLQYWFLNRRLAKAGEEVKRYHM
ncbi:major facilitator superfamily protein [Sarocladium implicatum]|nr:major facilitator superfamily protein [Sarocladium implicatum]